MRKFLASTPQSPRVAEQFDKLYKHCVEQNDVVVCAMLNSYVASPLRWTTWEEFLMDTILALSSANAECREHCLTLLQASPAPRTILVSSVGVIPSWGENQVCKDEFKE